MCQHLEETSLNWNWIPVLRRYKYLVIFSWWWKAGRHLPAKKPQKHFFPPSHSTGEGKTWKPLFAGLRLEDIPLYFHLFWGEHERSLQPRRNTQLPLSLKLMEKSGLDVQHIGRTPALTQIIYSQHIKEFSWGKDGENNQPRSNQSKYRSGLMTRFLQLIGNLCSFWCKICRGASRHLASINVRLWKERYIEI